MDELKDTVESTTNSSFLQNLDKLLESLEDLYYDLVSEISFEGYMNEVNKNINLQAVGDDIMFYERNPLSIDIDIECKNEAYHPFLKSCIYFVLSKKLYTIENPDSGWSLLAKSQYYNGFSEGKFISLEIYIPGNDRIENARKGGNAKAAKHQPVKKLAVELLKEKRPNEGWKSVSEAARAIREDIIDTDKFHNAGLGNNNLHALLSSWMRKDDIISRTYKETCKPK